MTETNWRIDAVCNAPLSESPYVYSTGLTDEGTGVELVVPTAPAAGSLPGGALTDLDARSLARTWADALREGGDLEEVELHGGLTIARPFDTTDMTAEEWGERHEPHHLCGLQDWLPVRQIAWKAIPGEVRTEDLPPQQDDGTPPDAKLIRSLRDVLELPEPGDAEAQPASGWELLVDHLSDLAARDLRPFARMAAYGFVQLQNLTGPMSARGHLQALACHLGEEDRYTEVLVRSRELASEIGGDLFPATNREWEERYDDRRQGLQAVVTGLLLGMAFYGRIPWSVFNVSTATGMRLLAGPRYGRNVELPDQHAYDHVGAQLAGHSPGARSTIAANAASLRRFEPSYEVLHDCLEAQWLGMGVTRMPAPRPELRTRYRTGDESNDADLDAAIATALLAATLRNRISNEDWELARKPLNAVGIDVVPVEDVPRR